jgi:tetratricopeptide (TPR) repeat protein
MKQISAILWLGVFCLVPALPVSAQTLFEDHFENNVNDWIVESTDSYETYFMSGQWVIRYKKETGSVSSTKKVVVDQSREFTIECNTRWMSGIDNNGYGIEWGRLNGDNRIYFIISANGQYSPIVAWKESSAINRYGSNHLKVEKSGYRMKFYVNGTYVDEMNFINFYGDYIGFNVNKGQQVAFDDFIVKQTAGYGYTSSGGYGGGSSWAEDEYKRGKEFFNQKNYYQAETSLRNAVQGFQQSGEKKKELYASEYLAKSLYQQKRYDEAITLNFTLLALAHSMGDMEGIGLANNRLGVNYYAKNDYSSALIYFQGALAQTRQEGKTEEIKTALQNVIDALKKLGRYSEAQSFQSELSSLDGYGTTTGYGTSGGTGYADQTYADAEYQKGKDFYNQQNYSMAESAFRNAISAYQQLGKRQNELYASEYLAKSLYKTGRYDEAISLNFQLMGMASQLNDMAGVGLANNRLGLNYYAKGDYSNAVGYFQAALAQSKQTGTVDDIKTDLKNVIDSLKKMGRHSEAFMYEQELNSYGQ